MDQTARSLTPREMELPMHVQPITRIPLLARDGSIVGFTTVDTADADWVNQWTWRLGKDGEGGVCVRRGERVNGVFLTIRLSRELLGLPRTGREPQADHIDGDTLSNVRSNLRVLTGPQNVQNKGLYRNSTSGYRGVIWLDKQQVWWAQARLNGKSRYIGIFPTAEEANAAAVAWRAEHMPYSAR